MGSDAVERFARHKFASVPRHSPANFFVQSVSDIDDRDDGSAAMWALMHGIDGDEH